jgi:uncharacterized protein (DUF58 family)
MTDAYLRAVGPRDPARPGPGPIPDAAVVGIEPRLRRRVRGLAAGDHRAFGYGRGIELDRIRAYVPGDDVRTIDWNVTARTHEPHVREHIPERQLVTWLLLDRSASMAFGTADRRKADVAEGVALVVARVAGRRANRIGIVTFGAGTEQVQRPASTRRALQNLTGVLAEEPLAAEPGAGAVPDADALRRALAIAATPRARAGLIVVVSDFRGASSWQDALTSLAGRTDIVAVETVDPREQHLVDVGELTLVDPETGRTLRVDTGDGRLRRAFESAAAAERAELATTFRRLGVRHVRLSTAGPWLPAFADGLTGRGTRA